MSRVSFADQIKTFAKKTGLAVRGPDPYRPARAGLAESLEEYQDRTGMTHYDWAQEGRRLLAVGDPGTGVPCFDRDGRRILPEVEGERDDYAGPISRGEPYGMVEKLNDDGDLVLE